MKTAMISSFPPATGAGKYAYEVFRRLDGSAVDMVYCGDLPAGLEGPNVLVAKDVPFPVYRKTLNWYFNYPKKIPAGYDVYHATNQFLARVCEFRKPSVLTVLDLVMIKTEKYAPFLTNVLQKRALKSISRAEMVVAISEDTKKDIINLLGVDAGKVAVTYMGVDHVRFRPSERQACRSRLGLPAGRKIILHVGSDEPRRNIESVIRSLYGAKKADGSVLLVKIGKFSPQSAALIKKLGLDGNVLNVERASEADLPFYYSAADVFLCLDMETGFGMPSLEAMACGTAVVCSNSGAFPEVVGKGGVLINPTDVGGTASALARILSDEKLRKGFSEAAVKQAERFSWEKCAKETMKIYEDIA